MDISKLAKEIVGNVDEDNFFHLTHAQESLTHLRRLLKRKVNRVEYLKIRNDAIKHLKKIQ